MNKLHKSPDENLLQYQLRLFKNKDTYDLNFQQIADLINEETGQDYGESKYRKYMVPFIDGYDFAVRNNMTNSEAIDELELKKIELVEERKKLQTIRVDYNKIAREKSRKDLMYEMIKDSIETLPVPNFEVEIPIHKNNHREAVLAFGDAHWGKVMESLHNSYSPEIFEKRMERLIQETVYYLQEKEDFTKVTVLNMADSIEGMSLRISQLQALRTGFIDQTISFGKFMAKWLNELSKYFYVEYKHIPSSNHSEIRPFNTKRGEFPAEDLEKVIINYIHDVLENNPRVSVPMYKDSVIDFQLAGYEHAATHGHAFRVNKNTIRDLSMQRR